MPQIARRIEIIFIDFQDPNLNLNKNWVYEATSNSTSPQLTAVAQKYGI